MTHSWSCLPPRGRTALGAGLVVLGITCSTGLQAQTVYKWTDEQGTVHFSDVPPAGIPNVEERTSPPPPPVREVAPAPPAPAGEAAESKSESATVFDGPARVVLTARDVTVHNDTTREIRGEVRNVGGEPAVDVEVVLRISDSQRNECSTSAASVEPTEVASGAKGTFDVTVTSPCFFEEGSTIDVEARWR